MTVLLVAIAVFVVSGLAAIPFANRPRAATMLGAGGALIGCVIGLVPSVRGLFWASGESLQLPWHVPGGAFHVQLDALSAFFLVPIFVLAALSAVYGGEYLLAYRDTKTLAPQWLFFNLFVASMALVVVARNAVLFLVSWEVMSLAAFFLVTFEHEKRDVRVAGWIYLVATHLGAAFLLAMFLLLGRQAHSLDFDDFAAAASHLTPVSAGLVFVLALIGFGAKAGLVPLHVWLPEAHPAAPSHVSALMSGVMIKIGIYGILRTMMFLGAPAAWWGPVLVIIGLVGGVLGVSLALFQRDLKRALAYSSIENVGLIVLALGVGVWGITSGHPTVAILGLAGGLLHIWNHSLMKGLMFLSAGSVLHGTGTKDLEQLGGLMKRMPRTGIAMTLGALAIAAVPPLNGFVSEWLIYMAMLRGGLDFTGISRTVLLLAVGVLALIGGLASICFVRLVGIVLLGEGRSEQARHAHESSGWMTLPLSVLAVFCVIAGVSPGALVSIFSHTVEEVFGVSAGNFTATLNSPQSPLALLGTINVVVWSALILGALILLVLRKSGGEVSDATWGCGYVAPTPRIQYTGQSFAELMVTSLFPRSLRPKTSLIAPQGLFPSDGQLATEFPDPLTRGVYQPFFERWAERFAQLRWVQQGKIHYYLLYFVVVLVLALAWVVFRGVGEAMSQWLILLGIGFHAVSGVPGLFCRRDSDAGQKLAAALGLIGSALGIVGAVGSLWQPPAATMAIKIDAISVIFLLPIFLVPALGGVYGLTYWKQAEHIHNGQKLRLFYGLVTAALAGVTIAANSILFLVAWEIMALSAFFLITTEDEDRTVREAVWLYLIAAHTATLCLFALFALLRSATGSFALVALPDGVAPGIATAIFLLATIGFGLKAGVMPLHVWLPGAHAMSPSHVSALMSGVLIKIGIYGLVRICSLLPHPPLWWGGLLLAVGTISGVLGVVFAIGQHDLKRLLAYHSVENIGIITMGLGLAMVGRSLHRADCVVLGLAGALLHVWNHGLFKSVLFFSAGAVIHATHTREIDRLGGLAKAMPRTALCFAAGAVAICGLPPLNGFVSELLIYLGLFRCVGVGHETGWAGSAFALPALALIGALAVACFVKAFGTVFLGAPRSEHARHAQEASASMTGPMFVLVGCCLLIGLAPLAVAPVLERGVYTWSPDLATGAVSLASLAPLGWISVTGLALIVSIVLTGVLLVQRLRRCGTVSSGTWDCGYAAPTATMQYTSSSFAEMLVGCFAWVLRPRVHAPSEQGLFPRPVQFRSHVPDIVLDGALRPGFRLGAKITSSFRFLQAGNIHAYLFYIVVFLILLLLWR